MVVEALVLAAAGMNTLAGDMITHNVADRCTTADSGDAGRTLIMMRLSRALIVTQNKGVSMLTIARKLQNIGRRMRITTVLGALAALALPLVLQSSATAYDFPIISGYPCPKNDIAATGCKGPKDCLYPHPSNCNRFVQCNAEGLAYDLPCAADLHFNDRTKECDYPNQAGCGGRSPDGPDEPMSAPVPPHLKDVCRNQKQGAYADPKRCDCLYECDRDHAIYYQCCKPGLLYQVKSHNCLPPKEVQCGNRTPPAKSTKTK